jgi:cytochrome c oxidase subunit III
MAQTFAPAEIEVPVPIVTGGNGHGGRIDYPLGGDDGSEHRRRRVPSRTYRKGIWVALTAVTMMFAAFTSTIVVRKGAANDWSHIPLPYILYWNTVILLASSVTLELSRRSLASAPGHPQEISRRSAPWLHITAVLGLIFVAGQFMAWRTLVSRGVYLASNPSSSSFYLLTGAHGAHLLGGIAALLYLVIRSRAMAAGQLRTAVGVAAIYWHFMDGLWIYILLLLAMRL